jgi:hypothetical protein
MPSVGKYEIQLTPELYARLVGEINAERLARAVAEAQAEHALGLLREAHEYVPACTSLAEDIAATLEVPHAWSSDQGGEEGPAGRQARGPQDEEGTPTAQAS